MDLHASLGDGWGLGEVADAGILGVKEQACVKESKMHDCMMDHG